jgi:predicted secreted Zn-dependent protease
VRSKTVTVEVEIRWGSKNSGKRYTVSGKTLEDAKRFMSQRHANGRDWALFDYKCNCKPVPDAKTGDITKAALTASYSITMPRWTAYKRQPQTCRDEWDRMWKALKDHENEHAEKFVSGVNSLKKLIESNDDLTEANVKIRIDQWLKDTIDIPQQDFDQQTDHGRKRGVYLNFTNCQHQPHQR